MYKEMCNDVLIISNYINCIFQKGCVPRNDVSQQKPLQRSHCPEFSGAANHRRCGCPHLFGKPALEKLPRVSQMHTNTADMEEVGKNIPQLELTRQCTALSSFLSLETRFNSNCLKNVQKLPFMARSLVNPD